ncbi:Fic family protein [Rhodoferax sp. 4810]|nr:Fic family protein [Rhodoferax jenense]
MPSQPVSTPPSFIWQHTAWPALAFDAVTLAPHLDQARLAQGKLLGLLDAIGLGQAQDVQRELWVQEALATAAIEGEKLNLASVRSSVAHRLGLTDAPSHDRDVEGLVLVMHDAVDNCQSTLDLDRLCRWQSALFPGGTSGITRIAVGRLRDHGDAMQIISGPIGREVVHYTAPPSSQMAGEMARFLAWFEATRPHPCTSPAMHGLARAAVAHLWFESIHPFEDGNGRLGRAVVDMALAQDMLAQDMHVPAARMRVFGMARQMLTTRAAYYDALNLAQRRPALLNTGINITAWVQWFVQAFTQGCASSSVVVRQAVDKAAFRLKAAQCDLNLRQHKVLDRLLEAGNTELGGGFLGGMTTDKYAKITGTSKPTATRDLTDLLAKGLLQVQGVGKATRYTINVPGWQHPATPQD